VWHRIMQLTVDLVETLVETYDNPKLYEWLLEQRRCKKE
jgi:hypothetical protein